MKPQSKPPLFDTREADRKVTLIRFHAEALARLLSEIDGREPIIQYELQLPFVMVRLR